MSNTNPSLSFQLFNNEMMKLTPTGKIVSQNISFQGTTGLVISDISELQNGLNAIEVDDMSALVSTLELIKMAADKGELDNQINAVSQLVRDGFKLDKSVSNKIDRDKIERKSNTLKLPIKTA